VLYVVSQFRDIIFVIYECTSPFLCPVDRRYKVTTGGSLFFLYRNAANCGSGTLRHVWCAVSCNEPCSLGGKPFCLHISTICSGICAFSPTSICGTYVCSTHENNLSPANLQTLGIGNLRLQLHHCMLQHTVAPEVQPQIRFAFF